MQEDLKQRKIVYYASAYMTNVNYLIVLLLLSYYLEYEKNPYYSIIIWGVPALISIVSSFFIIRNNLLNNHTREQGILKIGIAHIPSLLGLLGAFVYLFILI